MEKRNRLDRRGQSPPPDSSNRSVARVASAAALGAAFVAVVWVIAPSAGVGSALPAAAGLLTVAVTAWTAWLGYRTALVNRETAEINRGLAERERSVRPAEDVDPLREGIESAEQPRSGG